MGCSSLTTVTGGALRIVETECRKTSGNAASSHHRGVAAPSRLEKYGFSKVTSLPPRA